MNRCRYASLWAALTLFGSPAMANLVFIGVLPSTGNGIGAVNTTLTIQNSGIESGCVGWNGSAVVTGPGTCPSGFAGGDEKHGSSQENVYTATQLGFTATNNFSNLVLVFNGDQTGVNPGITLNALGLTLYSSTGNVLATFTDNSLPLTVTTFPGIGNAGFAFALDSSQAAVANALLALNPGLEIGTEMTASMANAGPETLFLTTVANTGLFNAQTPEPAAMLLMISGLLLLGVSSLWKRLARSS